MPKIVITTVPFVDDGTPLAAPAVLKASLQQHGIDCVGLDLNVEIYNKISHHPKKKLFLDFFWKQNAHEEIVNELTAMLRFFCVEILSHRPDIIGLSLFSTECQVFAAWLCAMLRQAAPDKKIIIGGPGLETLSTSLFKYPERLRQLGLIDDFIVGDADKAIVKYVQDQHNSQRINDLEWSPDTDLNELPVPDFSDYRFFRYDNALLPIVDSRGCVQNCEFCDVISFWKKFQSLTADNIFKQMMSHIEKYQTYRFQFSSSICNGNLKEFRKLMKLLSDYNQKNVEEQIHWVGSFIVRPARNHSDELWQLIKNSNGYLLTGVESIVERVRIGLGKKFSNLDLDHHLEMGRRYQVPMNLLIIAAYYTETPQDYEYVKQWFMEHKDYANNTVMQVQMTLPSVLPGTRLASTVDLDQFNSTQDQRHQQGRELHHIVQSCGFVTRPFFSV